MEQKEENPKQELFYRLPRRLAKIKPVNCGVDVDGEGRQLVQHYAESNGSHWKTSEQVFLEH